MTSDSASPVTRSSRSLRRALLALAACLAIVGALRAQEPAPEAQGPGAEAPEAARAEPAEPAAAGTGDGEAAPAGPQDGPSGQQRPSVGPTPGRFEPTEKVRADFDVSFPVDI